MTMSMSGPIDRILDKFAAVHAELFGNDNDAYFARRRASLVADGEQALRVLNLMRSTHIAPNPMPRAALVIDYLARNAPGGGTSNYRRTTIPVDLIAKMVGLGKKASDRKKLETMQTIVASYLDGTSKSIRGTKNGKGDSNDDNQNQHQRGKKRNSTSLHSNNVAASSSSSSGVGAPKQQSISPSNLIRDLCIQLGPLIPDAEFVSSYALRIYDVLATAPNNRGTERRNKRFSRYELHTDMQRNKEYYEAGCFYLAVKKSEGAGACATNVKQQKAKNAKKKSAKKGSKKLKFATDEGETDDAVEGGGNGDEEDDGQEEDRLLNETDVISAVNLLGGTFKAVLDCIRDWIEGVDISMNVAITGSENAGESLFEVTGGMVSNDAGQSAKPFVGAFERWKQNVLEEAKTSVAKLNSSGGSKDWLKNAADEVIRDAGLQSMSMI